MCGGGTKGGNGDGELDVEKLCVGSRVGNVNSDGWIDGWASVKAPKTYNMGSASPAKPTLIVDPPLSKTMTSLRVGISTRAHPSASAGTH